MLHPVFNNLEQVTIFCRVKIADRNRIFSPLEIEAKFIENLLSGTRR